MATTAPGMERPASNQAGAEFLKEGLEQGFHGYEEEDTGGGMDFGGVDSMGYEDDLGGNMNFGFEAPPVADPFAPGMEEGFDVCSAQPFAYPNESPPPAPTAEDFDMSVPDDVCNTSDFTESVTGTSQASPPPAEEEEAPPPTPDVDYDAEELAATHTPERTRDLAAESEAAAAALKEMGLDVAAKPKRKTKKDRKSKKKNASRQISSGSAVSDDVEVAQVKRRSPDAAAGEAAPETNRGQPLGPLPTDSAATLVNENESTLGSEAIEADTQSPNDVLLTFRQRLVEVEDAVNGSPKLRYTSVAASEGYIAFGMATGGTFIFSRGDHSFQCALPGSAVDRSVCQIEFAPDDHLLAVAVQSGAINLWRGPWGHLTKRPQLLKTVVEHDSAEVTSMSWSANSKNLFVGDSNGLVTRSPVLKAPMVPATSKMFPHLRSLQKVVSNVVPQTDVVHRCGCAVVQVEAGRAGVVLVSSLKQTLIADPTQRALWVVGKKLRYGEFGACFGPGRSFPAVFSARPGSRIWIAKSRTGAVTATISVRDHFDCTSTPILNPSGGETPAVTPSEGALGTNFSQLIPVREHFLLSWSRDRIVVIDPGKARLVGWYTDIKGIIDVSVVNDEVFVLHEGPPSESGAPSPPQCVHLALLSPGETAAAMTVAGNVIDGAAMLREYYQNATPQKFLANVQEADLALVLQQLNDEAGADPELVSALAELAARSAELRKDEEVRQAADAEQQFLKSLDRSEVDSLVVDATQDMDGNQSDDGDFAAQLPGISPRPDSLVATPDVARKSTTAMVESEYGELDSPIVT